MKIFFSISKCPPSSPQARRLEASATEKVPISLKTIFDGLGTLTACSSSLLKNLIGQFFAFVISIKAFSSFFISIVAKPAIEDEDSSYFNNNLFKQSSINSAEVFLSQPIPTQRVLGCQATLW